MITLLHILDYLVHLEKMSKSVYKQFPSHTSTNALSSLEMRVISVFLKKSKTSEFVRIKSPPSGGHVVMNDVGQHQK
jgi:hypothetical protein